MKLEQFISVVLTVGERRINRRNKIDLHVFTQKHVLRASFGSIHSLKLKS